MIPSALPRAWRIAMEALALAAGLACIWPEGARAQLPAPPASARSPFRVGGYGSLVLVLDELGTPDPGGTAASAGVTASAAALLVSGTLAARFSYFGELDGATRSRENWPGRQDNRGWDVARLYGEVTVGDALRLRAGRFLTPVGQWNELHADPLTWTSQRPLTSYRAFAKSVTGVMAAGEWPLGGHDAGYAIYWAPVPSPGIAADETSFLSAVGGRVALEMLPGLYLGASAAAYRASRPRAADEDSAEAEAEGNGGEGTDGAWIAGSALRAAAAHAGEVDAADRESDTGARRLLGADLSWSAGRLEILAETTVLSGQGAHRAERGGFVQAALPLVGPVFAVLRTEAYTPVVRGALRIQTLGLTARPSPHLTLKLERQITSRPSTRAADGWFASASAIF